MKANKGLQGSISMSSRTKSRVKHDGAGGRDILAYEQLT